MGQLEHCRAINGRINGAEYRYLLSMKPRYFHNFKAFLGNSKSIPKKG